MAANKQHGPQPVHRLCLLVLVFNLEFSCGFFSSGDHYRRELSVELNPGLNSSVFPKPAVSLLHVRALGNSDTLHYLFCSLGAPALLLVHTNTSSSTVQVDWSLFLARNTTGSLKVEPENSIIHSSAVVFTRLWEYADVNDTADPETTPPSSFFPPYQLENFTWFPLDNSTFDPARHTARLCGRSLGFAEGFLCLQFTAYAEEGRGSNWPRLLHSSNSSQISVSIEGLPPRDPRSRFSLELQTVARPGSLDQVKVVNSIDDEYTPSIFKVSQWLTSASHTSPPSLAYVQWKPVAYRQPSPMFEDATPCHHTAVTPVNGSAPASGLVQAFYGFQPVPNTLNISFGIAGDPFYNGTRYLSWTVLVGVGTPPVDAFSPLVITIMAVCFGTIVVLLLLLGGACVYRHQRASPRSQAYQSIN